MAQLELHDIQGIVMSGYGHLDYASYLFVTMGESAAAREWLKAVTSRVATGEAWPTGPDGKTIKPETAVFIALTAPGLGVLGLPDEALHSFPQEFQEGMASERRSRVLGDYDDSAPERWDIGGTNGPDMHAIIILLGQTDDLRTSLIEELTALGVEHGVTLLYQQDATRLPASKEHFGFLDGVSQPKVDGGVRTPKAAEPTIKAGEFILGYENEYGQIPNSPHLTGTDIGRNGSYVVVRKLRQDVAAFWQFINTNTDEQIEDRETARAFLAAKFVGRWPGGAPLILAPDADDPDMPFDQINRFLYHQRDANGNNCPLGAHIRRMNPRDSLPPTPEKGLEMADRHQLIRRGMPYGDPLFDLTQVPPDSVEDDSADRGLVFLAINANIARQFEFVMQTWANNSKFHGLYSDRDPIIGDCPMGTTLTIQREPVRRRVTSVARFTQVRGGGYFFLPSITALKIIGDL
jgi:Dyp-type peroxidase family